MSTRPRQGRRWQADRANGRGTRRLILEARPAVTSLPRNVRGPVLSQVDVLGPEGSLLAAVAAFRVVLRESIRFPHTKTLVSFNYPRSISAMGVQVGSGPVCGCIPIQNLLAAAA